MGGGSFSVEPEESLLDAYVLGLSAKPRPKICFVPTASGDSAMYITKFYEAFGDRAEACHVGLFGRPRTDMASVLTSQDIIYVGGGNTANMLAVWRVHGVDRMLADAWERGVILTGVSAGMICWFEAGVTDSFGPLAALRDGLGLLPASARKSRTRIVSANVRMDFDHRCDAGASPKDSHVTPDRGGPRLTEVVDHAIDATTRVFLEELGVGHHDVRWTVNFRAIAEPC